MSSIVTTADLGTPLSENPHLLAWIDECARLCKPDRVVWCDGSEEEKERLTTEAVAQGVLIPLNQEKLPGCYLHRSHPATSRAWSTSRSSARRRRRRPARTTTGWRRARRTEARRGSSTAP